MYVTKYNIKQYQKPICQQYTILPSKTKY